MKPAVQIMLCLAVLMTAIPAAMACEGWRGSSETASNVEAAPADTVPTDTPPQAADEAAACGCSRCELGDAAAACENAAESGVKLTDTSPDAAAAGCPHALPAQTDGSAEDS
jgi:hypothetical protein